MHPPDPHPPLPDWLAGGPPLPPSGAWGGSPEPTPPLSQTPPPSKAKRPRPDADGWVRATTPVTAALSENGDTVSLRFTVKGDRPRGFRGCRVKTAKPAGVRGVRATGKPMVEGGFIRWELGALRPDQSATVQVFLPAGPVTLPLVGAPWDFELAYEPESPPRLEVVCHLAPGDTTARVTITNPTHVAADKVIVHAAAADGQRIELPAPTVAPGGSADVAVELPPAASGACDWQVWAESDGTHGDAVAVAVLAAPPAVTIVIDAADTCPLDETIDFRVRMTNPGPVVARDLRVTCELTEEFTPGGVHLWGTSELAVGDEWTVSGQLFGAIPGVGRLRVRVTAASHEIASADAGIACRITSGRSVLLDELLAAFRTTEAAEAAPAETQPDRPTGERHVLFAVGGAGYATPIGAVREVVRPPAVTPLPGSPGWLCGVTNVRGDIATVIDLPRFLDLEAADHRRAMLVVQTADDLVGLLVDDVAGIRRMTPGPLDPGVREVERRVTPFINGVAEVAGRLVQLLDLTRVVAATEAEAA